MAVVHAKVSAKADSADTTLIRPSDWNATHTVTGLTIDGTVVSGTVTTNLIFSTDNTLDIGASGATRPRTGYFGTSLVVPTVTATTLGGTLSTAAQPNITSVGILAALHMTSPVVDSGGLTITAGALLTPDGTVAAPSHSFGSEAGSGLYRIGAGDVGLSILGVKVAEFTASAATIVQPLTVTGTSIKVGTNPATLGYFRLPNAADLYARNAANSANAHLLGLSAADRVLIDADNNGVTIGGVVTISGASLSIGTNPAGAGVLRIPNAQLISARNAANSGNVDVLQINASNLLELYGASVVIGSGYLQVGATPATTGTIRIPNNTGINFRNAANSADRNLISSNASDQVNIGDTNSLIMSISGSFFSYGTTPATTGMIRIPKTSYLIARNNANSADRSLIGLNASDLVDLGDSTALVNYNYAVTALGGGAAPTVGTIGGSGPATAAQNSWLKVFINGVASYVPIWR